MPGGASYRRDQNQRELTIDKIFQSRFPLPASRINTRLWNGGIGADASEHDVTGFDEIRGEAKGQASPTMTGPSVGVPVGLRSRDAFA